MKLAEHQMEQQQKKVHTDNVFLDQLIRYIDLLYHVVLWNRIPVPAFILGAVVIS